MVTINNHRACAVVGGFVGIVSVHFLIRKIRETRVRNHLSRLRIRKQNERQEQLELLEHQYRFGPDTAAITSLSFDELVRRLQSRELKARQVLEAYVAKAIMLTRESNCVTEFITEAFAKADELDAMAKVKGPLHGVPLCVKDDHHIAGMDSTLGLSINLYKPKTQDAVVIQLLEEAGAIPFCKTNIPQTEFSSASDNPIFGTTLNPFNKLLSPGGSSSGTGCLVGGGGALFGTGSDLGGSVRIPAHFCGISSLKPTLGRISGRGLGQCLENCAGLSGVSGILAAEASTLAKVYSVMLEDDKQFRKDMLTAPIPWNSQLFGSKQPLRIGYFTSVAYFPTIGDTAETVLKAKDALNSGGHTLVPFELPDPWHMMDIFATLAGADGGNQIYGKVKFDYVSPPAAKFTMGKSMFSYLGMKLSSILRLRTSSRNFVGDPSAQRSEILWEYLEAADNLKYRVADLMNELKLDAILSPAFPFPASKVGDTDTLINGIVYTAYWNLLDFPCGIVPFGKESCTKVDAYDDEGDFYLKLAKEGAKLAKGMPIGVQIIAKPFQEETVIRLLVELENFRMANPA